MAKLDMGTLPTVSTLKVESTKNETYAAMSGDATHRQIINQSPRGPAGLRNRIVSPAIPQLISDGK